MAVVVSTGFAALILGPHSFVSIFQDGCIEVRSGAQPGSADMPATGDLLGRITRDGGDWTPGVGDNGLRFAQGDRTVSKAPGHIWTLRGLSPGTAGWCRLLPNVADSGLLSVTAPRIDGAVGLVGSTGDTQLWLPNITITPDTAIQIDQWWYAMPPLGE